MNTGTLLFKHTTGSHSKALNAGLWTSQVLLAGFFGMAGYMKFFRPLGDLAWSMPWIVDVPGALVRFIGFVELAGAIGILVPAILRILPMVSAWAGIGLAALMLCATGFHVMRGELAMIPVPIFVGILAAFVAWGRLFREPILPMEK